MYPSPIPLPPSPGRGNYFLEEGSACGAPSSRCQHPQVEKVGDRKSIEYVSPILALRHHYLGNTYRLTGQHNNIFSISRDSLGNKSTQVFLSIIMNGEFDIS
jgi:hypothetical protein